MKVYIELTLCTDDDCILQWKDHLIYWKETWIILGESREEVLRKCSTVLKEIEVLPRQNKENYVAPMKTVIKKLLKAIKKSDQECYIGGNWWGEYRLYDSLNGIIVE
jgi:uncharacterized protein YaeQ